MHISKMNIGRSCKTKQKKKNLFVKMNCIDFEVWPVNRRFVQEADVLVRERRRTNRIYTIYENKTAM